LNIKKTNIIFGIMLAFSVLYSFAQPVIVLKAFGRIFIFR
jgi:hypothetical protein